ncbi:DUF1330 domain-containing protein [Rhizobium leguminosarum]|uniref:DUF1330 domain-containing protein n=1 Tax=Rhizobium leguminosarum TaxID=384 RepID=UPI001C987744|nr:DUF1330 domain-containing protein [Rhizobium leguminosarum]MBY5815906.1 DUF1330 domain-containing protein [Rhizobium leguminosarum]
MAKGYLIAQAAVTKARTVIFEFDSFQKVQAFWDSPEYAQAKALRASAADADFILIEGAD